MEHSRILYALVVLIGLEISAKNTLLEYKTLLEEPEPWLSNSSSPSTLAPMPGPVSPSYQPVSPGEVALPIHLSVIILISLLVLILFIAIYVQLIMVIWFGYKLLSYQTVLLYNILLWASLRLTLYSFYYYHCCEAVRLLNGVAGWVLVAFPAVLQYLSLAVLVKYFGESLFKVFERRQEMATLVPSYKKMTMYRIIGNLVWLSSVLVFLAGNIAFYVAIDKFGHENILPTFRVLLLDGLFLIMGITLGVCIVLIYTTRVGKDVLEAQRVHKCWPLLMSILLVGLFLSRAVYNIVAVRISNVLVFGDGSTFTTDMADNEFYTSHGENYYGYVTYFAVLVIWETIPTYLIVVFFRVRLPAKSSLTSIHHEEQGPAKGRHFFENPHRYDEVDHLLNGNTTRQVSIPSIHSLPPGGYGSLTSRQNGKYSINHPSSTTPHSYNIMPGTTPPQLFTSPSNFFSER